MIATKEMPVTVGVFVRPGQVPAPMKGTAGRRNRGFEYDGVNDNNLRFLAEELLPFVAGSCTSTCPLTVMIGACPAAAVVGLRRSQRHGIGPRRLAGSTHPVEVE